MGKAEGALFFCRFDARGISASCRLFFAGHALGREQIKDLVFINEMNAFGMQTNKVSAVLPTFASDTGFDTEEICICAVGALSQ